MNSTDTVIEQLSTLFAGTLTAIQTPEFLKLKNDLGTWTHTITSLEESITGSLSAIPKHPYERLKFDYFPPGYEFKNLESLKEPDLIPLEKCIDFIKGKNKELLTTSFHNLTCCEEDKIDTAFHKISGDSLTPDYNKQKNYIEFVEMVRNIPIDSVTYENCTSIARKLIGEYMKVI